ncbi:MAG: hypothetical protein LBF33_01565, partial [Oscillospiraceae bacterium]|nr:hypothetical protein [Oscillospiraceae bacterium]
EDEYRKNLDTAIQRKRNLKIKRDLSRLLKVSALTGISSLVALTPYSLHQMSDTASAAPYEFIRSLTNPPVVTPNGDFDYTEQPTTVTNVFSFNIPIYKEDDGKVTFVGYFQPGASLRVNYVSSDAQKVWLEGRPGQYISTKFFTNTGPNGDSSIPEVRVKNTTKVYAQPGLNKVEGNWPVEDPYPLTTFYDLQHFDSWDMEAGTKVQVLGFGLGIIIIKGVRNDEVRFVLEEDVSPVSFESSAPQPQIPPPVRPLTPAARSRRRPSTTTPSHPRQAQRPPAPAPAAPPRFGVSFSPKPPAPAPVAPAPAPPAPAPPAPPVALGENYYQTRNFMGRLQHARNGLRFANGVHNDDMGYALQRLKSHFERLSTAGYPNSIVGRELQSAITRLEERMGIPPAEAPQPSIALGERYYRVYYNPLNRLENIGEGLLVANEVHNDDVQYAIPRLELLLSTFQTPGASNPIIETELQAAIACLKRRIEEPPLRAPLPNPVARPAPLSANSYSVEANGDINFLAQPRKFQNKFGFFIPIFREHNDNVIFEGEYFRPNEEVSIKWISTDQQKAWLADDSGRYIFTKFIANFVPKGQKNFSRIRVKTGAKIHFQPNLLKLSEEAWPSDDLYPWIDTDTVSNFEYFEAESEFTTEALGFGFGVVTIKGINDNEVRFVEEKDVTFLDDAGNPVF